MTTTSGLHRWRENLRQLPGRTPLRVKMITALLALVAMALVIISVASLTVFRNYQIQRANQQLAGLYQREWMSLNSPSQHGPVTGVVLIGPYLIAVVPNGTSLAGQVLTQPGLSSVSLPDIPTASSWFKANGGKAVNVNAVSGSDNWLSRRAAGRESSSRTSSAGQRPQNVILIAAVDLGDINGTIGQLAGIDLMVERDHNHRPGHRGRGHRPGQPAAAQGHRADRAGDRRG